MNSRTRRKRAQETDPFRLASYEIRDVARDVDEDEHINADEIEAILRKYFVPKVSVRDTF